MNQPPLPMVVSDKTEIADGVVALTLTPEESTQVPSWTPGAHIDLVLRDDLIRQYSLCGARGADDSLTVAVLREQDGRGGSATVHDDLAEGDRILVSTPRNHFELVDAPEYLFIAGGIGITPISAMIAEAEHRGIPWRLLYGGRTRASMAFADTLAQAHPERVTLWPQDEHGLLDLAGALADTSGQTEVYSCGPEPLLLATEEAGAQAGRTLHVERFTPRDSGPHDDDAGFAVELTESGITVEVGADQSILDAVLDAGVDADFSCREGTCGTCEVVVLRGTPDHRDSILDEDERAACDAMMICVSRSRSSDLAIEL